MSGLVILTADELIALDTEGWSQFRRGARMTPTAGRILRALLDDGGPVPVASLGANPDDLVFLHNRDLIRVDADDGYIDLAYPFSASPTPFMVRLSDGRERYACCATDALGFAPMIGQSVEVRSRCQWSSTPLEFTVTPDGPEPDAAGVMVWSGKRAEVQCRYAWYLLKQNLKASRLCDGDYYASHSAEIGRMLAELKDDPETRAVLRSLRLLVPSFRGTPRK